MTLRIIGGTLSGRRLLAPPGLETRPLPDRIKQSLFDWLGQECTGWSVADVCAGSGSFGCETLSRGARLVHLVESSRHAISILQANIRSLGSPEALRLHARPFQNVLPGLHGLDLVFLDPPFPWFAEQPDLISELMALSAATLGAGGRMVIRGERGCELPHLPARLREGERRFYGRSWIAQFSLAPQRAGLMPPLPG